MNAQTNNDSTSLNQNSLSKLYVAIIGISIPFLALSFFPSFAAGNDVSDIVFETVVIILALVVATYSVLRGKMLENRFSYFFGFAIISVVITHTFHIVSTMLGTSSHDNPDWAHLQAWSVSNIILSVFLAYTVFQKFQTSKTKHIHVGITFMFVFSFLLSMVSHFFVLPSLVTSYVTISNPYSLVSTVIAAFTLVYYLQNNLIGDSFKKGIVWFISFHLVSSLVFSVTTMFDNIGSDLAHIMEIIGYSGLIFFIMTSIYESYKEQRLLSAEYRIRTALQKETELKFSRLYDDSPIPYLTVDLDGTIIDCNKESTRELGYKKTELIGTVSMDLAVDKNHAYDLYSQWLNDNSIKNKEIKIKRKNGSSFAALIDALNIENQKGETVAGLIAIKNIQDLSDAKKSIEEKNIQIASQLADLQNIARLKDEFASMITHELKTPLVPIIGYCEMFKEDSAFSKNLTKENLFAIDEIHDSATHLLRLIQNILDINKLELGKIKLISQKIDLPHYLQQVILSYEKMSADVDFILRCPEKLVVDVDKTRLRQIIDNLLQNAVHYVPKKDGKITVSAEDTGDGFIRFSVENNGPAIPKEKQHNLFKKFYQLDTSIRRESTGSGLGLAICKGLAERMGGKIWLESDGVEGVKFCFTISKNLAEYDQSSNDDDNKKATVIRRLTTEEAQ